MAQSLRPYEFAIAKFWLTLDFLVRYNDMLFKVYWLLH
jgi:hypothetical protein